MTPEAQRIAIAEACGWKPTTDSGICWDDKGAPIITPPDYLNDLNAMHEAEKIMTDTMGLHYSTHYYEMALPGVVRGTSGCWVCVSATAAQRAEAFLRCLGRWEGA